MKLKDWREQKEISGAKFAEMIGVSQSTVSRIETDRMWPDKATLERIVTATEGQVTANDFLDSGVLQSVEAAE